jgi:DNA-binding beta-propeller fold protein YncE
MLYKIGFLLLMGMGFLFAEENVFQYGKTLKFVSRISNIEDAEITAYMPLYHKLFAVGGNSSISVFDLTVVEKPVVIEKKKVLGHASSVAVFDDLVAVSLISDPHTQNGRVDLYRYGDSLSLLKSFSVCPEPDMLTFTPNGAAILVACEGSPSEDGTINPEGAIALIQILEENPVSILKFDHLDSTALIKKGVRKTGPGTFFQNLEPEYITVDPSSKMAWVSLQENNAIGVIDLKLKKITNVFGLGALDHSILGQGLDFRKDGKIKIENAPILGLRQPDGIAVLSENGRHYILTANEGASRNYSSYSDETDILSLFQKGLLNPDIFNSSWLTALQKHTFSIMEPCSNGPCNHVYAFGSRSMSVFDGQTGKILFDSGDQIEKMIAKTTPSLFNWNAKKGKLKIDARSEDKGAEPEMVTIGEFNGKKLAFLGLERMTGIIVWDLKNPEKPAIIDYYLDPKDRGPEGILFISAQKSPFSRVPLLIVGYEYSQSIVIYSIQ